LIEHQPDWLHRFDEFIARKEHEARGATIPPLVTELDVSTARGASNRSGDLAAFGNDWTRSMFDGPFYASPAPTADRPSTSLVFVRSSDGNTAAKNPSSLGGGEADKHLIYEGLSRVPADAILAGAETMRSGNIVLSTWHPEIVALRAELGLPRHPNQIIATLRGVDFNGFLFNVPVLNVILLTVPQGADLMSSQLADRPWIVPIVMPSARDLPYAFRQLRQRGIQRISCIGGRTLAAQLIDAGLVQDLYLTTSPRAGGEPKTTLPAGALDGDLIVRKHGTAADTGVVFEHFRLRSV
jgi:5-amino-6-(5-phosphoribosylamino)uracil reductase